MDDLVESEITAAEENDAAAACVSRMNDVTQDEKRVTKSRNHDKASKTLPLINSHDLDATIEELKSKESLNHMETREIQKLKNELQMAKNDAEQAHHWRAESAEMCCILTSRLDELAGFLDSLLKNKDILSVLAQDHQKAMREAVDNSLDLSRSLSMSGQGRLSLNEQSLISDVLKDSFFAGRFSFDETDRKNSLLIENLRNEVQTLKSELDRIKSESNTVEMRHERNVVRNLPQVNTDIETMFEREAEKLESLKEQLTMQFNKDLDEKVKAEKEYIIRDYIPRSDFDELSRQYSELERRLVYSENLMRDNEAETERLINEKEQIIRSLERAAIEMKEKCETLAFNEEQFESTLSASQDNARNALSSPKSVNCYGASSNGDQTQSDETGQRSENPSPDLGVDSDGTEYSSETKETETPTIQHDCAKIDEENAKLHRKLERIYREYKTLWAENQKWRERQKQIEKATRMQIVKTNTVLENVRSVVGNINNNVKTTNSLSASTPIYK